MLKRAMVVGAAVFAAVGLAAPAAQAATTTSCATGAVVSTDPGYITLGSSCAGFVDHGASYVFDVATTTYLVPPRTTHLYYNVVATCTGYDVNPTAGLQGNGCTYSGL